MWSSKGSPKPSLSRILKAISALFHVSSASSVITNTSISLSTL
ncbi:MAG: hypothetical protein QXW40_05390 [Thermofilum sp.]